MIHFSTSVIAAACMGALVFAPYEAKAAIVGPECVITDADRSTAPSNVNGASSVTHYVVATDIDIAVYRRDIGGTKCAKISFKPLKTFFSENGGFDVGFQLMINVSVVYDWLSKRFFLAVIASPFSSTDQYLYVAALSSTGAVISRRRFVLSEGSNFTCKAGTTERWRLNGLGVSRKRLIITADIYNNMGQPQYKGAVFSVDKATVSATPAVDELTGKCFQNLPYGLQPPIHRDTATTSYLLATSFDLQVATHAIVVRRKLSSAGAVTADAIAATPDIQLDSMTCPAGVRELDWVASPPAKTPNGKSIEPYSGIFLSPHPQIGGFLWQVHSIDRDGNGMSVPRWRMLKFSTSGKCPLAAVTFDTIGGAGEHHDFYPSVAVGCPDDQTCTTVATNTPAFVTFNQTRPTAVNGRPAFWISRGPNGSASGWTHTMVERSPGQTEPCTTCPLGPGTAVQVDPADAARGVGFSEIITGPNIGDYNTRAATVGP